MNPQKYAQTLKATLGIDHAVRVAHRCVQNTATADWASLPLGPVFGVKAYGADKWDLKRGHLTKLHVFWVNVHGWLKNHPSRNS